MGRSLACSGRGPRRGTLFTDNTAVVIAEAIIKASRQREKLKYGMRSFKREKKQLWDEEFRKIEALIFNQKSLTAK